MNADLGQGGQNTTTDKSSHKFSRTYRRYNDTHTTTINMELGKFSKAPLNPSFLTIFIKNMLGEDKGVFGQSLIPLIDPPCGRTDGQTRAPHILSVRLVDHSQDTPLSLVRNVTFITIQTYPLTHLSLSMCMDKSTVSCNMTFITRIKPKKISSEKLRIALRCFITF